MIWFIPVINALFGWCIISALFFFMFHPHQRKNFFIFEMQGFIPKHLSQWGAQTGKYVSEQVVNIGQMKEGLLQSEKLKQIHALLEEKVDDFLRNKLKEKIPIISMFISEGLVSKMKEVLVDELDHLVPQVIDQIAAGVEEQFDVQKIIAEKLNSVSMKDLEKLFYQHAGKSINTLKFAVAIVGFLIGYFELCLVQQ